MVSRSFADVARFVWRQRGRVDDSADLEAALVDTNAHQRRALVENMSEVASLKLKLNSRAARRQLSQSGSYPSIFMSEGLFL